MRAYEIFGGFARSLALVIATIAVMSLPVEGATAETVDPDKEKIALSLANLLRAARSVISDQQTNINDFTKGDKGVTSAMVTDEAKRRYLAATEEDLDTIDRSTLHGRLVQLELDSIAAVVDEAQPKINRPNLGFKGFLPAIFAALVAENFRARAAGIAEIKLTAPKSYVRNNDNLPDKWENSVIEQRFKRADHPHGQHVSAFGVKTGKPAFRLILPEYYAQSCLACHGGPKGKRDITGGVKEGGQLNDLGGAISVVLYSGK